MNLGTIVMGFVAVALVICGIVFVGATATARSTDTYGGVPSANANLTNIVVQNVTAVGTTSGGLSLLVIACIGLVGGVSMLWVYSKTK